MTSAEKLSRIYEELSGCYARQKQGPVRDRLLVLAADAASSTGNSLEAERLRARLLQLSPHHLLKPFPSFAEAAKTKDVQSYIAGLRRTYPAHAVEGLLENARKGAPLPDLAAAPLSAPAPTRPPQPPPASSPQPLKPQPAQQPSLVSSTSNGNGHQSSEPVPEPAAEAPIQPRNRLDDIYSLRSEPRAPNGAAARVRESSASTASVWVSTTLFSLVLAGGVALAAFCAARPFLAP
jgi:hypothetical protein